MKLIHSPYVLLLPVLLIAVVQAKEVIARIKQSIWFHEKFAGFGYDESVFSITAGRNTLILFIIGSVFGMALGIKGYRDSKLKGTKILGWVYACAFISIAVFACVWVGMIMSPLVELRPQ